MVEAIPDREDGLDDVQDVLLSSALDDLSERKAKVEELCGDLTSPRCAILQWPGRRTGNRQLVVIVPDTSDFSCDTIGCVLIGKELEGIPRPCSCYEHPTSQARWSCVEKRKIKQLWDIERAVAEQNGVGGAAATGAAATGAAAAGAASDVVSKPSAKEVRNCHDRLAGNICRCMIPLSSDAAGLSTIRMAIHSTSSHVLEYHGNRGRIRQCAVSSVAWQSVHDVQRDNSIPM